jgi:hypothetical protein
MILITYGELVLMCFGIGFFWILAFLALLYTLERWGLLKRED